MTNIEYYQKLDSIREHSINLIKDVDSFLGLQLALKQATLDLEHFIAVNQTKDKLADS